MSELLLWILIYSPLNRNLICSSYDGSVIKKILLNKHFYPATPLCSKHFTEIKFGVWVLNQWYHSFILLSLCLLVILGHFYSDTLFLLCLIFTRFYCLCSCFLCLYAKMHWVFMISRVFPHTGHFASAFAASASQSCWLQILPYMVIHCSLPDRLPRPFPPCPAIGCFVQCKYTCEFWDRPKYEERPRWENWVGVRCCFCQWVTHCIQVPYLNILMW